MLGPVGLKRPEIDFVGGYRSFQPYLAKQERSISWERRVSFEWRVDR